jgi:poly-gamma-glutamate biosynthesis protein PgsC/CapC
MFAEAMGLSLVGSLVAFEWAGLSPGGLIVPGYLALLAGRPFTLLVILAASFLALGAVRLVSAHLILFSRRRFVFVVLAGLLCMRAMEAGLALTPSLAAEVHGLGYLVPGLVANDMEKQGILPTLCMMVLVGAAIRGILLMTGMAW